MRNRPTRRTNNLRHKIEIWGDIEYMNEVKAKSKKFDVLKTIHADVIPQTGSLQRQQADTILTNITHKIIVRYEAGKDITQEMEIRYRGHKFEIRYILNPYFENRLLEIFVQEVLR